MFRSAVFKLTAAYVAIVMAICLIFSAVLYRDTVHELHTGFYNQYNRWFNAYEPFGLRSPGAPAGELALRSHHILIEIIYFNVLVLVVTAALSYIMARRTLQPIQAAHEQQKRFTADVSHELRTPLTAMRMENEVGLMDSKSRVPELRGILRSNLEEVGRMESLVNNLLLLSTIEAGKLRTQFRRLDIREIVEAAIQSVRKSAEAKDIAITSKLDSKTIPGDRASLTQLFTILLENAIKYSPSGAPVNVAVQRGRGRVIVDIQDKGPGIAPTDLPHIFDRFYRADSARSKPVPDSDSASPSGFGLGLSIAKLIADLHRGEIIISSTVGSGTSATIILPSSVRS